MTFPDAFYAELRAPDFVPGYEVLGRLGGGSFGEVYAARKTSIGKLYAIKFLARAGRSAERELARVRLFAAIEHPNLVSIEDLGVARGVPYVVMGHAGDESLARRIQRGPLDADVALRAFVQVCRGVLALHDRRLAHFDLKPANVFLKGDVARVGDYGLAELLVGGAEPGAGRGTPLYMAPEMRAGRADRRADVYALGLILYEALTGELPFPIDAERGELARAPGDAPRPDPRVPDELAPIVERCLRVDPAERPATVHGLLDELGQAARPGDSVRIPWSPGRGSPGRGSPGRGSPGRLRARPHGDADPTTSSAASSAAAPTAAPPGAAPSERSSAPPAGDAPGAAPTRLLAAVAAARARGADPGAERRPSTTHGTVPVPPRHAGGLAGAAAANAALGLEVLARVAAGPPTFVARGLALALERRAPRARLVRIAFALWIVLVVALVVVLTLATAPGGAR